MEEGAPDAGVGRTIAGRYLLLKRLGSGGMGHVWLAHDQQLACEVALKEIVFRDPGEADRDRSARIARARAEARHAAWLRDHQNVVTVHDVLEHDGLPWIVMEYVPGAIDLRVLIARRGPLAPAECARIGLAVLDALTAGHERGIMHRDVKPANILLAPDRTGSPYARVLLTDYGISVRPDGGDTRLTGTNILVGTAGYLAPERADGGQPTPAADLFSLGCTLYYGVEGYGPFERDSDLAAVAAAVLEEPRPPLRAGALEPVLAAMLAKNPAHRSTVPEAEAGLSAIVTPQSPARTQPAPGSEPPWSSGATDTAVSRAARVQGLGTPWYAPTAVPESSTASGGQETPLARPAVQERFAQGEVPQQRLAPPVSGPWAADGFGVPPVRTGQQPGKRHGILLALLGGLLGLALVGSGAWFYMAILERAGDKKPYGDVIGLSRPLKDGDCVSAVWPDVPFTGRPRLSVVECGGSTTDGQVMALYEARSADEARGSGTSQCELRTEETREKLAAVRTYAVVPDSDGFETAGRRVACLLLGTTGPVYGPLGHHREMGAKIPDTAALQKQDCLHKVSKTATELVPCDGPHDQRVLGFASLEPETTHQEATVDGKGREACQDNLPPEDYGYDPNSYKSDAWVSESAWNTSSHYVVCTVLLQNGGTMEGDQV
ncbi:serine/threonine-protein kinase [Streptomyces spongiae]|uniref:non-specific serine/threonine protein kinase n=1 Tax=Streptomyces spongiae TaxID=565072 RepID=A0A5N8XAU6_9ACTN|nr:serine/threonine-protein kinase [Streptomyces spongiae]MPY56621.1 protein kinase [Streptomyces spongiae]